MEDWILALVATPWVYLALFAFATIDGFFPPIPSESVVIALAALATATGEPNLALLLPAAAAGAWTGDQIAFQIGRKVDVRHLRFMRSARAQQTLDWAAHALEQRGASFIIAARYIPVGRVAVNMSAGTLGFPRKRFMGLAAIAAITWACYSAAIGVGAGAWLEDKPLLAVAVGVAGGLVIGYIVDLVLTRVLRKRHERNGAGAEAGLAPTSEPDAAGASGTLPGRAS